jgi:hypothetical protein
MRGSPSAFGHARSVLHTRKAAECQLARRRAGGRTGAHLERVFGERIPARFAFGRAHDRGLRLPARDSTFGEDDHR